MTKKIRRPTKYQVKFNDEVVGLGREGKSIAQMCSHFDISRQTIDNWADEHPEFLEALSRAKVHMQAKLEEMGFTGLVNRDFNAAVWKKTMEARFRDDYTERREQNNTGNVALTFSSDDEQL